MDCCLESGGESGGRKWDGRYIGMKICSTQSFAQTGRTVITDIYYSPARQDALYLSMTRAPYDSRIVAYKTGTRQTVNLVLDTIRLVLKGEKRRSLRS